MKNRHLRVYTLLLLIANSLSIVAQENKIKTELYGFVRSDIYYETRKSQSANEGLFFLFPLDERPDANGEDLNAVSSLGFYSFNARPGLRVSGLRLLNADLSARVEADFAGFGGNYGNTHVFRLRIAHIDMLWEKSSLRIGQDWHPARGPVTPGQITLSSGAPFNAFNRSPLIRYDFNQNHINLSASAVFQHQMNSYGPEGRSSFYLRNAKLPELFVMANYIGPEFTFGVSGGMLMLTPRTESEFNNHIYKVDESIHSFSGSVYAMYQYGLFSVSAKSTLGQNQAHLSILGGYGVKKIDEKTGKQEYTNFKTSSSWINFAYGKKHRVNLLGGYARNLGSSDALVENSATYGLGLDIHDLKRVACAYTLNIPNFHFGLEYEFTHANYGDAGSFDWEKGRFDATHGVHSNRIIGIVSYLF